MESYAWKMADRRRVCEGFKLHCKPIRFTSAQTQYNSTPIKPTVQSIETLTYDSYLDLNRAQQCRMETSPSSFVNLIGSS